MTTKKTETPMTLADGSLEQISGGPHFRNFHGAAFDFQSGCDVVFLMEPGAAEREE